jgi:hypothetical protein
VLEEFEGEEILLAKLTVGALTIPTSGMLRKGDEVILVVRAHVDEIAFPPGDTPVRLQKSKVFRGKIGKKLSTTYAAVVEDPEERERLFQWLETAATGRDGGQMRLGDEGPNWLDPEPTETEQVELGDGPATTKRRKPRARAKGPDEGEPEEGQAPTPDEIDAEINGALASADRWAADAARAEKGEPPMTDEQWEASSGRVEPGDNA